MRYPRVVRLVLDTSVIVSAFRSRLGASYGLLRLLQERRFVALATPTLLFEYEEVLSRPEQRAVHKLTDAELDAVIRDIAALIEPVRVDFQWKPQLTDPDDEMVLEAAINGSAEAIVTHNAHDFLPAADRFRIQVLSPGAIMKARFSLWRP